jgi:hypothetical protein
MTRDASSGARTPSSDIEITGSPVINPNMNGTREDDYDEDGTESRMSDTEEGLFEEEEDEEMGHAEENSFYDEDDTLMPDNERQFQGQEQQYSDDDTESETDDMEQQPDNDYDRVDESVDDEETDDVSVVDSEDLQIIDEHHRGGPAFEDEANEGPTLYAQKAAEDIGEDPEHADEMFDEQGRPLMDAGEEAEEPDMVDETQFFVPEMMEEDQGYLNQASPAEDQAAVESMFNEAFGGEEDVVPKLKASEATSPLSSMASKQVPEIDPALTGDGFTDLAKRVMQRTGAEQSMKTSETSGLSSPPSSPLTEADGEEVEDGGDGVAEETIGGENELIAVHHTMMERDGVEGSSIDPALTAEEILEPPVTPGHRRTASTSFRDSQGHEVTPFRIEHPRAATGVVIIQSLPHPQDAAESHAGEATEEQAEA